MMSIFISSTLTLIMRFAELLSMMLEDGSTPDTGGHPELSSEPVPSPARPLDIILPKYVD